MGLKVAVQMDPIGAVNIDADTTFFLMLEAQARGHALWTYQPDALALEDGRLTARARPVKLQRVKGAHAEEGEPDRLDLSQMDVVLVRQDPPFDMAYITSTYFLDAIHPKTLVVNDPTEIRNAPEKIFVTRFPGVQPPTLITRDVEAIADFRARHGDIVLKPLYGGGGSGVARLKADDPNLEALLELHFAIGRDPVIAQAFLPAVADEGEWSLFFFGGADGFSHALTKVAGDDNPDATIAELKADAAQDVQALLRDLADDADAQARAREGLAGDLRRL